MRHDRKFLTVLMTGTFVACSLSLLAQQRGTAAAPSAAMIARGKYLVTIQDCNGCHTPFNEKGEPDMSRMLSGHPANVKVAAPRPRSAEPRRGPQVVIRTQEDAMAPNKRSATSAQRWG